MNGAALPPDDDFLSYTAPAVPSPCIAVCQLDSTGGWCLGCGRTGDEIARWYCMPDIERRTLVEMLPDRLRALETGQLPTR